MIDIIKLFDGPIKIKVKDGGSTFDLAFFNTSFAELLMEPTIDRFDDAEYRLKQALEYNPNYALAHYQLGKVYEKMKIIAKAKKHYEKFLDLWKDADEDLPELIDGKKRLGELNGLAGI